jgi:hypothetical protein
MMMVLLIGGIGGGVLLLGGLGFLLWFLFSGPGDDLQFVTDDTTNFTCVHVAELWKNDKVRSAMKDSKIEDDLDSRFGLKPEEVDRYTEARYFSTTNPENNYTWEIVATVSAYDEKKVKEKVVGTDPKDDTVNGKKFYINKKGFKANCVYFHSKTVFVCAPDEKAMKKILEAYPRKKSDGAISAGLKKASRSGNQVVSADSGKGSRETDGSVHVVSVSGKRMSVEGVTTYTTEEKAKTAKEEADKFLKQMKDKAGDLPEAEQKKMKKWLNSVVISRNGKELRESASWEMDDDKSSGYVPFGGIGKGGY